MASIKKRKSTYSIIYRYKDKNSNLKQKWETCKTIREANARKTFIEYYQKIYGIVLVPYEIELALQMNNGKNSDEHLLTMDEITLSEFLKIFTDIYGVAKWSVNTYKSKVASINNYVNPYIGSWELKNITTKKLTQFYNMLLTVPEVSKTNRILATRCVQPANIKKIHDIIHCCLNQAILWGYIDDRNVNPASKAILPKIWCKKRDVWDIDTFSNAIDLIEDSLLAISMLIALSCSLRIGEILGLTWKDVNIDSDSIESGNARLHVNKELSRVSVETMKTLNNKGIIKVFPSKKIDATTRIVLKTPKTESSIRTVWIPKTLAIMLAEHKTKQEKMKEYYSTYYNDHDLVISMNNGDPVNHSLIQAKLSRFCTCHGFNKIVFHSLRHLSTSYKLKITHGDLKSVQGDTGHAESDMILKVYSRIIDDDRKKNAELFEKSFFQKTKEKMDSEEENHIYEAMLKMVLSIPKELREELLRKSADSSSVT